MSIKDTPRDKIPWYPEIDEDKCNGCKNCFEFCSHGTYDWKEEKEEPEIANPYNCIVGCSSCRSQCPEGAIEFPPLSILKQYQ